MLPKPGYRFVSSPLREAHERAQSTTWCCPLLAVWASLGYGTAPVGENLQKPSECEDLGCKGFPFSPSLRSAGLGFRALGV